MTKFATSLPLAWSHSTGATVRGLGLDPLRGLFGRNSVTQDIAKPQRVQGANTKCRPFEPTTTVIAAGLATCEFCILVDLGPCIVHSHVFFSLNNSLLSYSPIV